MLIADIESSRVVAVQYVMGFWPGAAEIGTEPATARGLGRSTDLLAEGRG